MASKLTFSGFMRPKYEVLEKHEELDAVDLSNAPSEQLHTPFRRPPGNYYQRAFFLLLGLYGLTILLWVLLAIPNTTSSVPTDTTTAQVQAQDLVPDLPLDIPVVFHPDKLFEIPQDVQAQRTNDSWATLIPLGRGFVELPTITSNDDDETKSNVNGTDSEKEMYSISLFHQLHCLGMLSKAITAFLGESLDQKGKYDKPEHLYHCVDYLRQSIMCAGDITLEPTRSLGTTPEEKKMKAKTSGWGVTHMCRDWDAIWEFAESMRGLDASGSE